MVEAQSAAHAHTKTCTHRQEHIPVGDWLHCTPTRSIAKLGSGACVGLTLRNPLPREDRLMQDGSPHDFQGRVSWP